MANSRIRPAVRRRKVAHLAAYSRQFTVKNNTTKVSPDYKNTVTSWDKTERVGKFDVCTYGITFAIDSDGHYHKIEHPAYTTGRYKQPKNLRKKDKKHPSTFPAVVCKKMTREEYYEKLVQHKLARWERKNPCPIKQDSQQEDLFKAQFMEPWQKARDQAEERFRDFVVSTYDKLLLTGRFKQKKDGLATFQEEKVAELKDINGDGHRVNEVPPTSKLVQKAQKVTNEVKAKRQNLVCTNLRDHKRQKGRIILPQAA